MSQISNDTESGREAILELTKDLRKAAETMTATEARFLVDCYYQMQENRIRADGQIRSMDNPKGDKPREPHAVLGWYSNNSMRLENMVRSALSAYSRSQHMGRWAMAVKGIGPVLSAGLLAHIDINQAPTVGHIWRFAGLDPTSKWGKGQKRPWNAALKVICWKIGESFVKVSGHDDAFYGKLYLERKAEEVKLNEAGQYKDQAEAALKAKDFGDDTKAKAVYLTGKLPPAHIHARAKRWTTKIFLAHWHAEAFRKAFDKEPPVPYVVAHLGHAHLIEPPASPVD